MSRRRYVPSRRAYAPSAWPVLVACLAITLGVCLPLGIGGLTEAAIEVGSLLVLLPLRVGIWKRRHPRITPEEQMNDLRSKAWLN